MGQSDSSLMHVDNHRSWYLSAYLLDEDIEILTSELLRRSFIKKSERRKAIAGIDSGDEEEEDAIGHLSMDWQSTLSQLQRNRSQSSPADVLRQQTEEFRMSVQSKEQAPNRRPTNLVQDPQHAIEVLLNRDHMQRPLFNYNRRRWSSQQSGSNQAHVAGAAELKGGASFGDIEQAVHGDYRKNSTKIKQSSSFQTLSSDESPNDVKGYRPDAFPSNLQRQRDMSASSPNVHKVVNVQTEPLRVPPSSSVPEAHPNSISSDANDSNPQQTPRGRNGSLKAAFSTGFLNTIHKSSSFRFSSKSSSKYGSSKKADKKEPDSASKKPGFIQKWFSMKKRSKREKSKYVADADDDDDDENEISIVSPVREELIISRLGDDSDGEGEVLARELEPDTLGTEENATASAGNEDSGEANRNSFIEEQDGLLFFNIGDPNAPLKISEPESSHSETCSLDASADVTKKMNDKNCDTASDSHDSGSEASSIEPIHRFLQVSLKESIQEQGETGDSQDSRSSSPCPPSKHGDSKAQHKLKVRLSRTDSFRIARRPNPEPETKFVRGGVYRGSMPVVKRTSPAKGHPANRQVTSNPESSGIIVPQSLDLNFIRNTVQKRTQDSTGATKNKTDSMRISREQAKESSRETTAEQQLTFTPEEVARLAHHMQVIEKHNKDGAATTQPSSRSQSFRGERPKSDFWPGVKPEANSPIVHLRMRRPQKERPKSDLGGTKILNMVTRNQEWRHQLSTQLSANRHLSDLSSEGSSADGLSRGKPRRMSMPHPIKLRKERPIPQKMGRQKSSSLKRSQSVPDYLSLIGRSKSLNSLGSGSNSETSDEMYETMSLASRRSSQSTLPPIEDILENACTYAEALWDHVTLDIDELPFSAGDVVEVTDMLDKDWWWGRIADAEGWFPSTFVRLRVNQKETADDLAVKMREGSIDTRTAMQRVTVGFISKDQARANVVNEIITVEKDYVHHLLDVIEGYIKHARKRPEMFSKDRVATIFGNIEEVYNFSRRFLKCLQNRINSEAAHLSELGQCFIEHRRGFEMYSEYCNNHPYALCELQMLRCDPKFSQFFEACRLLQEMNEIPLEGFLLTPVQKICKYPLQLAELLKHTRPEHPDYEKVKEALEAMKGIASLINERKRRMESMEKIALWQAAVEGWQGPDLLELSSELIHSGELHKFNLSNSGWVKDRVFFLFDHQLVYCKRDLLKRDSLTYKGRMVIDCCDLIPIPDGRDLEFSLTVKNAWKIYDRRRDKRFLLCAKTSEEKAKWMMAYRNERKRVKEDRNSGFSFSEQTKRIALQSVKYRMQRAAPDNKVLRKMARTAAPTTLPKDTLPTSLSVPAPNQDAQNTLSKKRSWTLFGGKKTTR